MVEDKKRRMCCSISAFCFFPDQLGGGIFTYQSNYTLNDNCQYAYLYFNKLALRGKSKQLYLE